MIKKFYDFYILKHPVKILFLLLLGVLFLGYYSTKLEIDASSETLLLDDDKDLQFTRTISKRYYNPDFLLVTYKPNSGLLSTESLKNLKELSDELIKLEKIESITSILNVPLLQSPIQELSKLVDGIKTLKDGNVDKNLSKKRVLRI